MKPRYNKWRILLCICTCAVWPLWQTACETDDISPAGPDGDAGCDGDADSDTDTDTDADTDADSDTDSDGDVDADADTDSGTGVDSELCADYRGGYPYGPYGTGVGNVLADMPGMVDAVGANHDLLEIFQDTSKVALAIVNSFDTCPACSGEADQLETFLSGKPGLAIVTIMCMSTGPGDADVAASWASDHNLTNVKVWGDTTDYMYANFCSQAPYNGSYPSVIVADIDTMQITHGQVGGMSGAEGAIDTILQAEHPCAIY